MRHIVLLNPPFAAAPIPQFPLSVLAAGAMLDAEGRAVRIINGSTQQDFIERSVEQCRDAVCFGVSAMTGYQIKSGLAAARAVKQRYPLLPVVWGGWHGSVLPEETAAEQCIDVVVRGQGERALLELVKIWESGGSDLGAMTGICYKDRGRVTATGPRRFEDVNRFPPLPYQLCDIEPILRDRSARGQGRALDYSSSQGCPNGCTFCAEPLVMGRRWSGLAAERVVDDWARLARQHAIDSVTLVDSNFFVDRTRVEAICRGLLDRQLAVTWHNANGTVEALTGYDREMWRLLERAGCRSILVGAESGAQEMLDLADKKCSVDDILRLAGTSRDHGIKVSFSFMTGFPPARDHGEVGREMRATLRLIHDILRIDKRHDIKLFLYTPYPGSPLFQRSRERGLVPPRDLESWSEFELVKVTTPWITPGFKRCVDNARHFAIPYFQMDNGRVSGVHRAVRALLSRLSGLRLKYGRCGGAPEFWMIKAWWKLKGIELP